ncbi:hypothetical protein PISMIDRAFT_18485 [Pisolithus microcarpus 441]|uniref:Uncharacterized protein n=1 Tax=Pisolithus microcarpus 441 TaxID=765257 RepID=A0A0C9XKA1_9AGAM|nr:hypothetical protein PISMIDRAFT_18485 [Pisolithus microcarpus 441]
MRPHALSSLESLESLHLHSGRLLTLHLEKDRSVIWPSLIVGPVPQELSLSALIPMLYGPDLEVKYNMDPTSLVLFAIELLEGQGGSIRMLRALFLNACAFPLNFHVPKFEHEYLTAYDCTGELTTVQFNKTDTVKESYVFRPSRDGVRPKNSWPSSNTFQNTAVFVVGA